MGAFATFCTPNLRPLGGLLLSHQINSPGASRIINRSTPDCSSSAATHLLVTFNLPTALMPELSIANNYLFTGVQTSLLSQRLRSEKSGSSFNAVEPRRYGAWTAANRFAKTELLKLLPRSSATNHHTQDLGRGFL